MALKREVLRIPGVAHRQPVPPAIKIGNMVCSSMVGALDPVTRVMPDDPDQQAENLFQNIKNLVEAAGGTTDNIAQVTIYLKEGNHRDSMNKAWLKMFPDEDNRPARGLMDRAQDTLYQAQFIAVLDS